MPGYETDRKKYDTPISDEIVPPDGGIFFNEEQRAQILEFKHHLECKREKEIEEYLDFARRVVHSISKNIKQPEDVEQSGYVGLIEAVDRYDKDGEARFETAAYYRIRGSALEEIYSRLPVKPHSLRDIREWQRAEDILTQELQRYPTNDEVAERLGISAGKAKELSGLAQQIYPFSLASDNQASIRLSQSESSLPTIENISDESSMTDDDIIDMIDTEELIARLKPAIDSLKGKQGQVIAAHFLGGVATSNLATEMGVTFQAVNQVKNSGLRNLAELLAA
jgi:RNA polymerase sigma factor for flagellar operon FliA